MNYWEIKYSYCKTEISRHRVFLEFTSTEYMFVEEGPAWKICSHVPLNNEKVSSSRIPPPREKGAYGPPALSESQRQNQVTCHYSRGRHTEKGQGSSASRTQEGDLKTTSNALLLTPSISRIDLNTL